MSFVKREYVDQQTVITAENMNAIQDELLRLGVSEGSLWNSVTSAGTKASNALDNEAAAYNYHLQYHVGDYCLYQQKLYRCTVETPAAGETWNSSHWTAVTVGDEMIETASELSDVRNTLNHKADVIYDTASGDIASFPDGADGLPVKDLTVGIEPVQSGTGDPSPTNVRPISGWTGCNVTRTGKNLFDEANADWVAGKVINSEGNIVDNNGYKYSNAYIPISGNTQYCFQYNKVASVTSGMIVAFYNSNKDFISRPYAINNTASTGLLYGNLTTPVNAAYFRLNVYKFDSTEIQVAIGSTASTYESYSGVTIPITFHDSQGDPLTVYGGTLDVTSGVLTVDRASVDLGTLSWIYATTYFYVSLSGKKSGNTNLICSKYKTSESATISGMSDKEIKGGADNNAIVVKDSSYTDAAAFKTAMSGVQLVYELAQPQTYQLTPNEVTTLLGQNNIWSDTGSSTVEYPCDTKLYIQKINTPTDDDMIADAQIASGKYFIVGNNLYLSTAGILAGDPIKPGTNCTLTNLAAALNAINS